MGDSQRKKERESDWHAYRESDRYAERERVTGVSQSETE